MGLGEVEGGEDQPVDEAVLEIANHREFVLGVGAGGMEHQAPALRAGDLLDRAHHRRVDGVADVGHREGDLPRPPRAQGTGGSVWDVSHGFGRFGHAREGVGVRPDPVQHAGCRCDGDVREAGDRRDRGHSVLRLARGLHPPVTLSPEKVY